MPLTARKPSQTLVDLVGAMGGSWHGRTAMCRCPIHDDRTPSLSLRQGDRGILVTCFAGCDREDILREIRRVPIGSHFEPPASSTHRPGSFQRLWEEARPISGTLGERYLAARHLLPVAGDVRFHPRCPYKPRPWTTYHPAVLIAVRQAHQLVAVQRIFLDPETADYRMKLMLGQPGGGAWRGEGQGSSTRIALAEGFETARAFTRLHSTLCWASLGSRRLHQIAIPEQVTELILAGDNDAEGLVAVERAEGTLARPGLTITRRIPEVPEEDWADVLERMVLAGDLH